MAHSNLSLHHGSPDLQISRPIEALHGLECVLIFRGKKMEPNSFFNKFQKMGPKLGGQRFCMDCSHQDNVNAFPNEMLFASHKVRTHYSEDFFSEKLTQKTTMPHSLGSPKDETSNFKNLFKRGCICRMDDAAMVHVEQQNYAKLKSCNSRQGASIHDSHTMVTQQVGRMLSLEIPQNPPMSFGWLSLGVCGNALIMRVGSDARCFHQQGLVCGREDFREQIRALDMLYVPVGTKSYDRLITGLGSTSEVMAGEPASVLKATTTTTKNRPDKLRGKNKHGKTATSTRDLFERSSFHLCEVIFCYPFMSPNLVTSNFQRLSRESLRELVVVVNQVAVGLAGTGVALMLFVGSRMLSINAAFDKHKMVSLAMGVGFLSLSLAMKRVADVVKCMADAYSRARAPRKEHLIRLQKELHGIALNPFPLIAVCLIRFGAQS